MSVLEVSQIIFNITVSGAIIFTFVFICIIAVMVFKSVRTFNQFILLCKKEFEALGHIWRECIAGINFFRGKKSKKKP